MEHYTTFDIPNILASFNRSNCFIINRNGSHTSRWWVLSKIPFLKNKGGLFRRGKTRLMAQHKSYFRHCGTIHREFLHAQKPNVNASHNFMLFIRFAHWWINYFQGSAFSPKIPNLKKNSMYKIMFQWIILRPSVLNLLAIMYVYLHAQSNSRSSLYSSCCSSFHWWSLIVILRS